MYDYGTNSSGMRVNHDKQIQKVEIADKCVLRRYEHIRAYEHIKKGPSEPCYFVTIPAHQLPDVWDKLTKVKSYRATDKELDDGDKAEWGGIKGSDHMRDVVRGKELKLIQQIRKEQQKGEIDANVSGSADALSYGTHIAGGNVIVPAVLANHPKAFFRTSIMPKEAVTVWIDGFAVWYEKTQQYQKRLIKAVAAAQRIALTRPVKLMFAIAGSTPGRKHMVFSVEVRCFPPDWGRLAFTSHTAFLRIFGLSMQANIYGHRSPNWYKASLSNYVKLGKEDLIFEED